MRAFYGNVCAILGVVLNLILSLVKFVAALITNATSLMADSINNLSDSASSIVTLLGFRASAKRADREHPFGHGRAEYISALTISILVIVMGIEVFTGSVRKIITPEELEKSWFSVYIAAGSILVKLYMAYYNKQVGAKIDSEALRATAIDSLCDCLSTGGVLICLLVNNLYSLNIDHYVALAISLFILFAGYKSTLATISQILGNPAKKEFVDEVKRIVFSHEEIIGIHDLIYHDYGPSSTPMLSLHAEVNADANFIEVHDCIDNIEAQLNRELGCMAVIHMDPIEKDNEEVNQALSIVRSCIDEWDESVDIHDFRMVKGKSHTNLIFDIVVPYKIGLSNTEIKTLVEEKVKSKNNKFNVVLNIDRPFIES
jgi:cation diffusion facilitator family transporter